VISLGDIFNLRKRSSLEQKLHSSEEVDMFTAKQKTAKYFLETHPNYQIFLINTRKTSEETFIDIYYAMPQDINQVRDLLEKNKGKYHILQNEEALELLNVHSVELKVTCNFGKYLLPQNT